MRVESIEKVNAQQKMLYRAKHMGTTALFESMLLPDWKRLMPDERAVLCKILEAAENFAVSSGDRRMIGGGTNVICAIPMIPCAA